MFYCFIVTFIKRILTQNISFYYRDFIINFFLLVGAIMLVVLRNFTKKQQKKTNWGVVYINDIECEKIKK